MVTSARLRSVVDDETATARTSAGRATRKFADIVYEQLHRLIARGEFPQGCKLPPEDDLSMRFDVSRPVIRDALARLKDEGFVRSQRGSGNVVVRGEPPGMQAFPPIRTISDLLGSYEFRLTVEAATASMAAQRRDPSDLEDIQHALDRVASELDNGVYHLLADLNFEFHRAIARATHNPFYLKTVEMIPNFIGAERLDITTFGDQDMPERVQRIHCEHVAIFEAIRRREPEGAIDAMKSHIVAARDYVLEQQTFGTTDSAIPHKRKR